MAIRTRRTIYVAIGRFSDASRESVHRLLRDYEASVRSRDEVGVLALFDERAAQHALRSARMIWQFESMAGEYTGATVHTGFSSGTVDIPADKSLAIQNDGGKLFGEDFSELASNIAVELEGLLRALGAERTVSGYID